MSPRPSRVPPAELCIDWPTTRSDNPIGEVARLLVLNLRAAIGTRSVREVAYVTGVDRATIGAVLNGRSWPELVTIAKLETGLGVDLWPQMDDRRDPVSG